MKLTVGKRKKVRGNRVLFNFLIPYIIVLNIPLVMGIFYYFMTIHVVEDDYKNANMAILQQCSQILDQRLDELNDIVNQLISNQYVQNFKNLPSPFSYPNSYRIIELRDNLSNFSVSNRFLLNYFLLFNNSKLALNNSIVYKYDTFYNIYFHYENMPYETWYQDITGGKYGNGFLKAAPAVLLTSNQGSSVLPQKTSCDVITYIQPLLSINAKAGYLMLIIDNTEFTNLLSKLDISSGGYAYVADRDNNVISYISSEDRDIRHIQDEVSLIPGSQSGMTRTALDGKNRMVSRFVSPSSGFRFVGVQPANTVLAKVDYIKYSILAYLSASLLFGFAVSFLMARRISKPVKEIVEGIPVNSRNERAGMFPMIKRAIVDLTRDNEVLTKAIDMQRPFLKVSLLGRLLKGEFNSEEEIDKIIRYTGIKIGKASFYVIIFKYYENLSSIDEITMNELGKFKVIVKEAIDTLLGPDSLYYDIDEDKLALVLNCNPGRDADIREYLPELMVKIKSNLPEADLQHIIISAGGAVSSLMDIPRSYEQARMSLSFNMNHSGELFVSFDQLDLRDEAYYFPQDVRMRLTNLVKAGDKARIKQLLQELFRQNILDRSLPLSLQKMFIYELWASVVRLANQLSVGDDEYQEIIGGLDRMEQMSDLKKINLIIRTCYLLCDNAARQMERQRMAALEKIRSYVRESYIDADLSLSKVSDRFKINEAYLSHIFKQHTGQNFSVYIERLRMEKAVELITNTSLPISEVAARVGYYSTNTFCRAFKRVYGFNTTVCRNSKNKADFS